MKKHVLFSVIIAAAISSKAQVGIGTTTPHSSAQLDVFSNSKGFLVPRMSLAERIAITSPAEGLMVYQTNGVKGYYYYDGSSWQLLSPPGWGLSGNANTTGTSFLGTTNAEDLYFKTNGELSGRISHDEYGPLSLGYHAGLNNTVSFLTAIGYKAVSKGNAGHHVTAVGYTALEYNTGASNTAVGSLALNENTSGTDNVAVGAWTLRKSQGSYNVSVGSWTLLRITGGSGNTVVGANAGYNIITGNNNTILGRDAGPDFTPANNTTSIGYAAVATADNRVRIGNNSVGQIGGIVSWTTLSDERFKNNIREQNHGLDFIMQLKPITYHISVDKLNRFIYGGKADSLFGSPAERSAIAAKESILYTGFSAQQVEQAAKQVGYDFSGVQKPANDRDHYALDYSSFVVPLVKGMQEQQSLIEALNAKNDMLQKEIEQLKRQMKELMKVANE